MACQPRRRRLSPTCPGELTVRSFLGDNPIRHLLALTGARRELSHPNLVPLTGNRFFPGLIAGPLHYGLAVMFSAACGMSVIAAFASMSRGAQSRPMLEQAVEESYAEEM